MSRKLIIFYSRTDTTRMLAGDLAKELGADMVAIQERKSRKGIKGYLSCLLDASRGMMTPIEPLSVDPSSYDLVLLGTPVWAGRPSCPMRRFLSDAAHTLPTTAYFCTYGGRGHETTFNEMCDLDGKPPLATLAVSRSEVQQADYTAKLDRFVAKLARAEHWREVIAPAQHAGHGETLNRH